MIISFETLFSGSIIDILTPSVVELGGIPGIGSIICQYMSTCFC